MPALKTQQNDTVEVRALGTPLPAPSKRRIWAQPEVASHSLVVLTSDRLYLAPLGSDPRPETVAAITAGGDVEVLLGPLDPPTWDTATEWGRGPTLEDAWRWVLAALLIEPDTDPMTPDQLAG